MKNKNLSKIKTEDLLDELWSRNGDDCFVAQTYDLSHLKSYLSVSSFYKEGDEKEFCQYLANEHLHEIVDEAISDCVSDFYKNKKRK